MKYFEEELIHNLFEEMRHKRVLIIGDVMLDSYLWGNVDRISPEAPVPVVAVNRRNSRLGGAANVALNIKSLGAEPFLCSVTGKDLRGDELLGLMAEEGLNTEGILTLDGRITTTKFRIFGNRTQMLRVDEESTTLISEQETQRVVDLVTSVMDKRSFDVIIFQDYDKGMITPELIDSVCREALQRSIPVAVDPKARNFHAYKNVGLFKPNLKEFSEGLKCPVNLNDKISFQRCIDQLHVLQKAEWVMITLSSEGVYISDGKEGKLLPAHLRNIADVSGAGDTVISVAALAMVCGLSAVQMALLGNLAGGLVCEEAGVVPVDREKLLAEALRLLV